MCVCVCVCVCVFACVCLCVCSESYHLLWFQARVNFHAFTTGRIVFVCCI